MNIVIFLETEIGSVCCDYCILLMLNQKSGMTGWDMLA